jgi:Domain of unknown function (DUF397)
MAGYGSHESGWAKSSYSGGATTDNCVEWMRRGDGTVAVRDSKVLGGGVVVCTPAAWAAFVDGARAGEFRRGRA